MIDARPNAHHGVSMRPRDADSGIDVVKSRVKVRVGIRAKATARREIEWDVVIVESMQRVEYVVSDTGVDREAGSNLPLIFCIEPIHVLALTHQRKSGSIGGRADLVVPEVCSRSVG